MKGKVDTEILEKIKGVGVDHSIGVIEKLFAHLILRETEGGTDQGKDMPQSGEGYKEGGGGTRRTTDEDGRSQKIGRKPLGIRGVKGKRSVRLARPLGIKGRRDRGSEDQSFRASITDGEDGRGIRSPRRRERGADPQAGEPLRGGGSFVGKAHGHH